MGLDAAGTVGSLYRYNGTRWSLLSDGLSAAFDCAVAPDGVLYVASSGGVMRYANEVTFEQVAASTQFSSIVAADDGTIFVGGASATLARRVSGSWAVLSSGGDTTIRGIVAYAGDDVVFVDDADSPAWARWNGRSISQLGGATPDLGGINGVARVAAEEHYAFGASAEHKPIIYRVERLPKL